MVVVEEETVVQRQEARSYTSSQQAQAVLFGVVIGCYSMVLRKSCWRWPSYPMR
jgi:hypothetical protein